MPPNNDKSKTLEKSDLRTSPVQHVINRWPGQVPDRRGLEANLMLRRVNAWSTPRPDPQVTQMIPTAQYAVSNLGLDSRTEGEWIRFLDNVVYPNVPEVKVRQVVLEKMMSDRMDPALRSVLWARVAALLRYMRGREESFEKAQGPIAVGKRGGKIYGYDKKGKPIYVPKEESKQMAFQFSPAAKLEKKDPGAEFKRLAEKLVDAGSADLAWAKSTLALESLSYDLMKWADQIPSKGQIKRKALAAQLRDIKQRFEASFAPARVVKVAGLEVETLDSAIEQHALEHGYQAIKRRLEMMLGKDRGKPLYTAQDIREGGIWGGIRSEMKYNKRIYQEGTPFVRMEAQTKPTEREVKERKEWEDTWRRTVAAQLSDVAKLPKSHHQLLEGAGARVRFLVHGAGSQTREAFVGGEVTKDWRTKADLIAMYSFSSIGHGEKEEGLTLAHEVGHLVSRLVYRSLHTQGDYLEKDHDLEHLFQQQLAERVGQVEGRKLKNEEYHTERTANWARNKGEWFAEAYRYAYRDGADMESTLQHGDFDHQAFRDLVNRKVDEAVKKGVSKTQIEEPVELIKSSSLVLDLVKAGEGPVAIGKRGGKIYGYDRKNNPLYSRAAVREAQQKALEERAQRKFPQYKGPLEMSMSLQEAEAAIRGQKQEHIAVFGGQGSMLIRAKGTKSRCYLDGDQVRQMVEVEGGATLTHNHPSGGCLSVADINLAVVANVKELRAVLKDGTVWKIQRPKKGWGFTEREIEAGVLRKRLKQTYKYASIQAQGDMTSYLLANGDKTASTKNPAYNEAKMQEIVSDYIASNIEEDFQKEGWYVIRDETEVGNWGPIDKKEREAIERYRARSTEPTGNVETRGGARPKPRGAKPVPPKGQLALPFAKALVLDLTKPKQQPLHVVLDILEKAAGHKYLRRWRGPDGKYRYEYKALATATLKNYQVGDKVAVKHKGQEGHFEVLKVREKDGKRELYVKHDETGKERWVSEVVLAELFRQTHDVAAQARNALHNISAELMGYDPMQGPAGPRKPKPTKYWQKQLEKRQERLKRLFDPYNEYHSIIDFGAKQELTGWYREELKDTVDQIKPIIANLNAEVEAARKGGAGSNALWEIRSRYIKETREPFKKALGRINGLVNTLNYAARKDIPILPEYQKSDDPDIQKLIDHAVATAKGLDRPGDQMQEVVQNVFSGQKDPEKWARNAKSKITRYFKVVDETFYANTALTRAREEKKLEKLEGRKITDRVAGRDATFLIHGKHVKSKEQITKAIGSLESAFDKVKRAGFGKALRDLTVHMDWTPAEKREKGTTRGHGTVTPAGLYHTFGGWQPDKKTGQVTVFSSGFRDGLPSEVAIHELGHRFYYRNLTDGQRAEWEAEIEKRSMTPTQEQIDDVWNKVKSKWVKPRGEGKTGEQIFLPGLVTDLEENHGRLGRALASGIRSAYSVTGPLLSTEDVFKQNLDKFAGHGTVDPFVSFYGGSNASEYFAEAFMFYVKGGPNNVPAWARSIFERLTAGQRMKKSLVLNPPKSLMHVVVDLLEKAQRGGKYIRRVPYTDKHGKTKYRYFYRESASARAAQEGEEIKLGDRVGKVLSVSSRGMVTVEIDGSPHTFPPDEWHRELTRYYGEAFQKSAEKRAKQTVNAIMRHVPKALLEDLKGETDEQKLAELKDRVPAVYDKLQRAFQRAGMSPFEAKRILAKTLERRGWEAEARAAAVGTVLTHRGTSITRLIDASENLAGGDKVEAKHVAAATELGAAGKGEPLNEIKNLAAQAERDVAKLASMLQSLQEGKTGAAELFAEAMASKALQKLNLLSQAFPGLADRAVQPARQITNEIAAETPNKPTREGAETVVYVAGEGGKPVALKARYRLVEADEIIASHKPDTFAQRQDYPAGVQERAYHRDQSEQAKVIRNAQRMDPRFVVNTNPDAVNGPPMATTEGIVLGGNSRAMSLQRIYSQHPEKATEMRQYLEDHAHEVGFKPGDIKAMKNPVLIREVEVEDKSKRNLQVLVRQMNESFTQGMDPRTMQVAMGRRIDQDTLKTLANDLGEDETLASFLASKRSERFVNALHRSGIIDDRNANQYTIKGTRQLNQDGVQLVSRILVGRTVQDADILSNTGPQMIEAVARAVPALTQATAHGEGYDIGPDLAVAIDAFNDLNSKVAQGVIRNLDPKMPAKDFKDLFNHFRTLPGIAEPHPVLQNDRASMLLELLVRRRGPTMMAKFGRDYAAEAAKNPEGQATMFGKAKSPTEVLADAVKRSLGGKPTSGPGQGELMAASFVMVPEGDDILNKSFVVVNGEIRRLVG